MLSLTIILQYVFRIVRLENISFRIIALSRFNYILFDSRNHTLVNDNGYEIWIKCYGGYTMFHVHHTRLYEHAWIPIW